MGERLCVRYNIVIALYFLRILRWKQSNGCDHALATDLEISRRVRHQCFGLRKEQMLKKLSCEENPTLINFKLESQYSLAGKREKTRFTSGSRCASGVPLPSLITIKLARPKSGMRRFGVGRCRGEGKNVRALASGHLQRRERCWLRRTVLEAALGRSVHPFLLGAADTNVASLDRAPRRESRTVGGDERSFPGSIHVAVREVWCGGADSGRKHIIGRSARSSECEARSDHRSGGNFRVRGCSMTHRARFAAAIS